jgi:peptidoglycan/LPS O-acetylase OafA/YrhL
LNRTARNDGESRLVLIDLLRFVAAISVVFFHYCFRGERGEFIPPLSLSASAENAASYGGMGVYLFFVISGFVIAYSAQGKPAFVFAISRFARLYPTYLFAMTITFFVLLMFPIAGHEVALKQYIANIPMFSKALKQPMVDGVYWSIFLEVIFYAWVFVLILAGVFDRWQHIIVAIWLAISILNFAVLKNGLISTLFITNYSGLFASGILIYRLRQGDYSVVNWLLLGVSAIYASWAAFIEMGETSVVNHGAFSPLIFVVLMITVYLAIVFAALYKGRIISPRLPVFLGALTYPLYLLHQMIGYDLIRHLQGKLPDGAVVAGAVFLVLLLAALVQRFFERPVVPWVRRGLTQLIS